MHPLVRLFCVWLVLLPASTLWLTVAKARGLSVAWALQLPLALAFTVLALVINSAGSWKLTHRLHIMATLGLALLLTMALAGTQYILLGLLSS